MGHTDLEGLIHLVLRVLGVAVLHRFLIARTAPTSPADEAYDAQMAIAQAAFDSEDVDEGTRAFAEKRAPVWKGR
ncbi:hypothetical protein ACFW9O_27475 [Streptomyces sp. NPDC059499]|uniref:hypothetical protein n=1 Tax=Streptomyces sp. NPDC059499 TaxID=3346852 RepID=UPI00369B0281